MDASPREGKFGAAAVRASDEPGLRIGGVCHAFFAYEIGFSVDMAAAEARVAEASRRQLVKSRRRAPAWFAYEPAPLRLSQTIEPIDLGGHRIEPTVQCTLYDFGAMSIAYSIPFEGTLEDLPELSAALHDNPALLEDSEQRVTALLELLGESVSKPAIGKVIEDYLAFAIQRWPDATDPGEVLAAESPTLARILQAETELLSQQQVEETMGSLISFGSEDLAVVDWNAAILFDTDPVDALAVLEHANVELAEMRHLDGKLDATLEQLHEALASTPRHSLWPLGPGSRQQRHLAELQVDSALLFEGVNNAIKLIGDQYLARLYRLVAAKFHLPEWDANVLRKLETAENIYSKMQDFQTTRRLEVLEIVIIVLIAVSIVLPFIPGFGK